MKASVGILIAFLLALMLAPAAYGDPLPAIDPGELSQRTQTVLTQVAQVRQLPFTSIPPVRSMSRDTYRQQYLGWLEARPASAWELDEQVLKALYLLPPGTSLKEMMLTFYGSAVIGYYDPGTDEIVVMDDITLEGLNTILAHELNHALIDQHFSHIFQAVPTLTDAAYAWSALIEGDAEVTEALYYQPSDLAPSLSPGAGAAWKGAFPQDLAYLPQLSEGFRLMGYFPYLQGPHFINYFRGLGGWGAVNPIYGSLPQSTEQIIHPQKYPGEKPMAVAVKDRSRDGWQALGRDRVGEMGLFVMLKDKGVVPYLAGSPYFSTPSAGWGGDELLIYKKDASFAYVWEIRWDTPQDAQEFAQGYRSLLLALGATETWGVWQLPGGGFLRLRVGLGKTILAQAPRPEDLEALDPTLGSIAGEVKLPFFPPSGAIRLADLARLSSITLVLRDATGIERARTGPNILFPDICLYIYPPCPLRIGFRFSVEPGQGYSVLASMPGYLAAGSGPFSVVAGETTNLSPLTLVAGDAFPDGEINAQDLAALASGGGVRADYNFDGKRDILDLVAVGRNFGRKGAQ